MKHTTTTEPRQLTFHVCSCEQEGCDFTSKNMDQWSAERQVRDHELHKHILSGQSIELGESTTFYLLDQEWKFNALYGARSCDNYRSTRWAGPGWYVLNEKSRYYVDGEKETDYFLTTLDATVQEWQNQVTALMDNIKTATALKTGK